MSKIRVQVITRKATDLAIDHIVNTVYFDDFNIDPAGGTDWQAFADDVREVFRTRSGLPFPYGVETKVYDMADAMPRPIKATGAWAQGLADNASSASGPREVTLCLSYYSQRNLPRFRGRIHIGPWVAVSLPERPPQTIIDAVVNVGTGLKNIGGIDVDWGLISATRGGAFSKVTAGWVDNEWDTIRSRGLRATSRTTYTTNE